MSPCSRPESLSLGRLLGIGIKARSRRVKIKGLPPSIQQHLLTILFRILYTMLTKCVLYRSREQSLGRGINRYVHIERGIDVRDSTRYLVGTSIERHERKLCDDSI